MQIFPRQMIPLHSKVIWFLAIITKGETIATVGYSAFGGFNALVPGLIAEN